MIARIALQKYIYYLHYKPWPTNILTTGVTIGIGDFISQYFIEGKTIQTYSKIRTAHFALIGCTITAPSLLVWYRLLDKVVKGSTRWTPIKKMALDQVIYSPYILASVFLSMDILNGRSFSLIKERLKTEYVSTLIDSYYFWPTSQTINFCLVPYAYRILFLRFSAIIWNTYLSWTINRSNKDKVEAAVKYVPSIMVHLD